MVALVPGTWYCSALPFSPRCHHPSASTNPSHFGTCSGATVKEIQGLRLTIAHLQQNVFARPYQPTGIMLKGDSEVEYLSPEDIDSKIFDEIEGSILYNLMC